MNEFWGVGNGVLEYAVVLLVYVGLFIVVWQIQPKLEPQQRKTLIVLWGALGLFAFIANYVMFLMGLMTFLPWLNNFIHTFLWIGVVLSFLYISIYQRPLWQQIAAFAVLSFVVKTVEHQLLGTWELDNFFGIQWHTAYMLGWSLFDGLIPVAALLGLRLASRYIPGLIKP